MLQRVLALVLCAALPLPALAKTHVIAELGTAPLIGQVASTTQLKHDVRNDRNLFLAAGRGLGLTPVEFTAFEQQIVNGNLTYVTIPRKLDAMSWRSGAHVHVLHDVLIPANTKGWEVDIAEAGQTVALFIPNKCGNLSLVRRRVPMVANITPVQEPPVPAVVDTAQSAPPPAPAPAPSPPPVAMPVPYAAAAMSTPSTHQPRLWPLLLLPLVALVVSHGHSGPIGLTPVSPAAPAPAPPPVAGCPTPAPH